MKRLVLLRHAKSSWSDEGLADHDRPLSSRGERDAPEMARRLIERGIAPALVLASTARRAQQTAKALRRAAESGIEIRNDKDLYLASPGEILSIIQAAPNAHDTVVVVGHNPGFTDLANMLLPGLRLPNLPTAGTVGMHLPIDDWSAAGSVAAKFEFLDYPKRTFERPR